jgi:hypothetical protein
LATNLEEQLQSISEREDQIEELNLKMENLAKELEETRNFCD